MADWFFIYDVYKLLKLNTKDSDSIIFGDIDLELIEHYNHKKYDYYSRSTYTNTIMPTMKNLIEELGCKQLLTSSVL